MNDLHWKTAGQAANFIKSKTLKNQETDVYG